jgi:hypothetical protein
LEAITVSLLKDLEQRFETIFEGFFARQFKSGVQPVEIAKKLSREMDEHRTIGVSKVYVPNHYIIHLNAKDAERLKPFERTLISELQSFLVEHARKEGYVLLERPLLEFLQSDKLTLGELRVESRIASPASDNQEEIEQTSVKPPATGEQMHKNRQPYLILVDPFGETVIKIEERVIDIGRSSENRIAIDDPNVSRQHAAIEEKNGRWTISDLESTNGTFVNGARIKKHVLRNGDTITIGITKLQYRE